MSNSIRPQDLRIGNAVYLGSIIYTVKTISAGTIGIQKENEFLNIKHTDLQGIELSKEILLSTGFEKTDDNKFDYTIFRIDLKAASDAYKVELYTGAELIRLTWINYFHELQNIVFDISDEELTLKQLTV